MSREIKFRAWDKKARIMRDDGNHPEGKPHMKYNVGVMGIIAKNEWATGIDGLEIRVDSKEFDIMQFVGLQDKNEKEIYEGDIVACWDSGAEDSEWGFDKKHIGIIEYTPDCYSLKIPGKQIYDGGAVKQVSNDVYLQDWSNAENIEVLGNIYEHPELLKQRVAI